MPIYEYECPTCSERFEKLVKMSDPTPACPKCEGTEVRKLVSAAAFVLKGGGWYKDHYGLKSSSSKSDGGSSGGSSSGGSSDSGSSSSGSSGSSSGSGSSSSGSASTASAAK